MADKWDKQLAAWVNEVKGSLSLRQVEIRTGLAHSTLQTLCMGKRPNAETMIRFARSFGKSVPEALRLAGHDEMADMWEFGAKPDVANVPEIDIAEPDVEPEWDNLVEAGYLGLDNSQRHVILTTVRALAQEDEGSKTTHGRKAK